MSSYSSLSSFTKCKWKRVLNSYFKRIPQNTDALVFGSAYHLSIEKGLSEGLEYLRKNNLEDKSDLLTEMVVRFMKFIGEHNIKILEHEIKFEITVEGCEDNVYNGYIDAIGEYNGEIYLMEFKTASSISIEHVNIDSQMTSYLWACKELEIYNPKGVLWICNRKASEKQPTLLKNGNLSTAKNQGVPYRAYKEKADEIYGDNKPQNILDFMEWLKQNESPSIAMVITTRTDAQIDAYGNLVRRLVPEETALLRKVREDGILSVKEECCPFPGQHCMKSCDRKDICKYILGQDGILVESDTEELRATLEAEAGVEDNE